MTITMIIPLMISIFMTGISIGWFSHSFTMDYIRKDEAIFRGNANAVTFTRTPGSFNKGGAGGKGVTITVRVPDETP